MNEEELFCKLYPEYVVNGKPLSPYFDLFENGYEQAEKLTEELKLKLEALEGQTPWKDIKDKSELIKENAQLKKEWQEQVQKATDEGYARTLQTIQLSKAKEIIKNLMVYVPVDLKEYEEAKPFLKGEGCPDCFCEDCTKEDCEARQIGLVEKVK